MKFRTEYPAKKSELTINPDNPVLLMGSCFSDNIARKMRESLWNGSNPFGALYNPISIAKAIELTHYDGDLRKAIEDTLFFDGQMSHSWLFGSLMSSEFREDSIAEIDRCLRTARQILERNGVMVVTFGTAWCYLLKERPEYVVGNCHKMPSAMFERKRLTVEETVGIWNPLAEKLKDRHPGLEIIFTISPVRHLKDGFEGNSRSKAILQLAVEEICSSSDHCHYFPAYEIYNDDLRDYRFFDSDLVHPSAEGVEYVWEVFKATYLSSEGTATLREGERIAKAWQHRPMTSGRHSEATAERQRQRLLDIERQWDAFHERHPNAIRP